MDSRHVYWGPWVGWRKYASDAPIGLPCAPVRCAVLAAVLVSGCGVATESPVERLTQTSSPVSPSSSFTNSPHLIATDAPSSSNTIVSLPIHANLTTNDVLIIASIVVEDRCLFLDGEGGPMTGIAWPEGTTWDADRQAVIVDGVEAPAGETVHLGGGFVDIEPASIGDFEWNNPPLPECLGDSMAIVGKMSRP